MKKLSDEEKRHREYIIRHYVPLGKTDREIGEILGISKNYVQQIRRRLGLESLYDGRSENEKKHEEYVKRDDANLDRGICCINLYGDELERYLFVKKFKERAGNYHVP